jgi:hypothetical protein
MLLTIRIFPDIEPAYFLPSGAFGRAGHYEIGAGAGFPAAKKLVLSDAIHDGAVPKLPACSWFR